MIFKMKINPLKILNYLHHENSSATIKIEERRRSIQVYELKSSGRQMVVTPW